MSALVWWEGLVCGPRIIHMDVSSQHSQIHMSNMDLVGWATVQPEGVHFHSLFSHKSFIKNPKKKKKIIENIHVFTLFFSVVHVELGWAYSFCLLSQIVAKPIGCICSERSQSQTTVTSSPIKACKLYIAALEIWWGLVRTSVGAHNAYHLNIWETNNTNFELISFCSFH